MKIIRFKATDVLRLTVVEVAPSGNVVTIGGKNGAGKSSLLDAIEMSIAGKKHMPEEPIRRGAGRAATEMVLGTDGTPELVVERIITPAGDTLVVRSPDGAVQKRPQEILNKLFTSISFDPLAFATQDPKVQAELLRKLVGLDLSDLEAERSQVYEARTQASRDEKRIKAQLDGMPLHDDAPDEEVNLTALAAQMAERTARVRARDRLVIAVTTATVRYEEARAALAAAEVAMGNALLARDQAPPIEDDDTEAALATAEDMNKLVRANAARAKLHGEHVVAAATWGKLDDRVRRIDEEKGTRLAAVTFPIPGLSLSETGVTYEGFPFEQTNKAGQLRVSLAIGMAMNPALRVMFVRDGSLLDEDGLSLVAKMAEENDCQVWMEDARTTDPTAVIIEAGHVKGQEPEEELM